jgi:beta-aspartyl-peptidase (threonine type)
MNKKVAIAIHGGAGTLDKAAMSDVQKRQYEAGLKEALEAGYTVLNDGGPAIHAVESAVIALENNPLFNAGKGSVLNNDGNHEMDAAIMDGLTLSAGAVAAVSGVKNPVTLARLVMEQSKYVLLCGNGAIDFAIMKGLRFEPAEYFTTDERRVEWAKERAKEEDSSVVKKFGTVGAVALDENGNLAAATSTGGLTNKKFGRVGDTPVIGCGTYANNNTCAVSCTGEGEQFIQAVLAFDISCLIEYKGLSLTEACRQAMGGKLQFVKGSGGLIAVDRNGQIEMPFNTEGMYRAAICGNGTRQIKIFE